MNTADAANAADQDPTTAATLQPGLTQTGTAVERVQFASVIPANSTNTGLSMRINNVANNLVMLSVLGNITIKAYLNGVLKGTWQASNLINLNVLNPSQQTDVMLAPAPSADFNQLELSAASAASAYSVSFFEAFGPSPAPLPVQLVSFAGKATATGVQLNWQTASELNNSHFVVERAASGEASFAALGQVAGAGSSPQTHSYQYVDAAPLALGYYRLRQVDATTGRVSYSPVVAVQSGRVETLAAYPSPAAATLTVASAAATQVTIFDQLGRLQQSATLAGGPQQVDVSSLPAGVYYLREASTGQSVRFVKGN
ncbi:T9SS type A sorting domain-containing protein [Hymenobacter sp. RP-2-7]|uniref:T9SS type A sorting domain-containing protein n=1 Tax=Hymenobacter polaris TaxID=2682546 RepID=A0A7Y0AB96_9BACT|nr:T9SS type A sorting domain-containing protein [Hymenobacter polaris]NML64161.1 T9SS type A sorting domain-containing protein [Hymenobacter polaris]